MHDIEIEMALYVSIIAPPAVYELTCIYQQRPMAVLLSLLPPHNELYTTFAVRLGG